MAKVEIYSTMTCPYCFAAKSLLDRKGIPYSETMVYDPEARAAMVARANGRRTVPQIFINDEHVGGYEEMAALERQGKLDALVEG